MLLPTWPYLKTQYFADSDSSFNNKRRFDLTCQAARQQLFDASELLLLRLVGLLETARGSVVRVLETTKPLVHCVVAALGFLLQKFQFLVYAVPEPVDSLRHDAPNPSPVLVQSYH